MDEKFLFVCSNCGAELNAENKICPDCGLEIEDSIIPDNQFTTELKSFDSLIDAEAAREILSVNNINSFINPADNNYAYPAKMFNEAFRLFVMEKDFVKAYEILEEYEKGIPEE